jgi:hypothetical protein
MGKAARERAVLALDMVALAWILESGGELVRVVLQRTVDADPAELLEMLATSWPKVRKSSFTRALPVKPLVVEARSEEEGNRTVDAIMRGRAGEMSMGTGDDGAMCCVWGGKRNSAAWAVGELGAELSDIVDAKDTSKSASASVRKGASPSMYWSLCWGSAMRGTWAKVRGAKAGLAVELRGRVVKAEVGADAAGLGGRKKVDAMLNVTGTEGVETPGAVISKQQWPAEAWGWDEA